MDVFLILGACLPILFYILYFYSKEKKHRFKTPKTLLIKLMFSGILSIFLTLLITFILLFICILFCYLIGIDENSIIVISQTKMFLILNSFIGIACVEEFSKFFILYIFTYKNKYFKYKYNAILYSTVISLGFALIENIFYCLAYGVGAVILRAFTAIPLHATCGIFMGYYIAKAKQKDLEHNKKLKNKNLLIAYLYPVWIHGMYDFLFMCGNYFVFVGLLFFLFYLYKGLITTEKEAKKEEPLFFYNYCKKCGTLIKDQYCSNCGTKNY